MYFRYLKKEFRDLMRSHALSDDDVRQAADKMKRKSKKTFIIGMVCYAICMVLIAMGFIAEYKMKPDFGLSNAVTGMALCIVLGFVLAYILPVGLLKFQFDRELKNTYPHLYDECKL